MERTAHRFQGVPEPESQGTDLWPGVRYDELARSLGCHGELVESLDQLGPAVERALAAGVPSVIHVVVDPVLNADPLGYEQFRSARTY